MKNNIKSKLKLICWANSRGPNWVRLARHISNNKINFKILDNDHDLATWHTLRVLNISGRAGVSHHCSEHPICASGSWKEQDYYVFKA